jgi:hypothetical protein
MKISSRAIPSVILSPHQINAARRHCIRDQEFTAPGEWPTLTPIPTPEVARPSSAWVGPTYGECIFAVGKTILWKQPKIRKPRWSGGARQNASWYATFQANPL